MYLSLFYRLAHYPAEEIASGADERDNAPAYRAKFLNDLRALVHLIGVSDCEDARQVRWEIVNACAIQDWVRARQLYGRLETLAAENGAAQVIALRGQYEILSVFARRWGLSSLAYWDASPGDESGQLILFLLLSINGALQGLAELFAEDELERLMEAIHYLERTIPARPDLGVVCYPLLALCWISLGGFRQAAEACEHTLERREFLAKIFAEPKLRVQISSSTYCRLVDAHRQAGEIERAINACQRWIEELPDQAGAYEKLAGLFQAQGNFKQAYECLRKEVDRNPERGEDPAVSMALAFGEVYPDSADRLDALRSHVDPIERDHIKALVRVHWPQVETLEACNADDWATACYVLLHHTAEDPSLAIFCFGRLVENEVRVRVYDQFRRDLPPDEISSICSGTDTDSLTNHLRKGTWPDLGQLLNELHPIDSPRSRAARRFREWLCAERPLLSSATRTDVERLRKLHNAAKHRTRGAAPLSWNDAEDVAGISRHVLSATTMAQFPRGNPGFEPTRGPTR